MLNRSLGSILAASFGVCVIFALAGCNRGNKDSLAERFPIAGTTASSSSAVASPEVLPVGDLPPRSLAGLKNALLVVITTRDEALLQKLAYPAGLDDQNRTALQQMAAEGMGRPITAITEERLESLGKMGDLSGVVNGVRYEPNLEQLGYLRIAFAPAPGKTNLSGMNFAYGMKNGAYYLVMSVRAK